MQRAQRRNGFVKSTFYYRNPNTNQRPNHALQRTAASRRGCNRRVSWPPSLSLGRRRMRTALFIVFSSALLLVGCGSQREAAITEPQHNSVAGLTTNGTAVVHGDIIAHIIGPHQPTADTRILSGPNTIPNFWVTLEVRDVRDGFAAALKGRTIKLPTCEFASALVGQTLPLRISYSPGRFDGSDYWLTCTSIEISRLIAASPATK